MKRVDEKLNGGKEGSEREGREERLNIGRNVWLITCQLDYSDNLKQT